MEPGEVDRIQKATALDLARASDDKSIVPWLLEHGAKTYEEKVRPLTYRQLIDAGEMEYEAISTTASLRMRSQPTLQGEVVGRLNLKEVVGVLRTSDEPMELDGMTKYWFHVCTKSGVKGWVFGGYLERSKQP
jgi:hypothetical protein